MLDKNKVEAGYSWMLNPGCLFEGLGRPQIFGYLVQEWISTTTPSSKER